MLFKKKIGITIPAYNEAGFITKTLANVPKYIDFIVCIDDGSTDKTYSEMKKWAKKDKRTYIIKNSSNRGVGYSIKKGLERCKKKGVDYITIAPGDNQNDLSAIKNFISICERDNYDVCRGNRFLGQTDLKNMSALRIIGNSVYSFVTKFVSGYYTLFDFQSSFSAINTNKIREIDINALRDDYLFDNSLWINLNITNARIKDIPTPTIYEDEISDINYFNYVFLSIPYLLKAFLNRIYQKYIFILHPVGVFLLAGFILFIFGTIYGLYIFVNTLGPDHTPPTAATVMLAVVPLILGFELLLNAIVLDIQNEPKKP